MVKLKGPGLATSASGQLAKQLIFSSSKGKAYLKKYAKPKQPRSKPQVALRANMDFLSKNWAAISALDKATWQGLATQRNLSPFNAYQSYNLIRCRNLQRPTKAYPAAETGPNGTFTNVVAVGGVRHIKFAFAMNPLGGVWGMTINHVPGWGDTPTWEDAVHMLLVTTPTNFYWQWNNLAAGSYVMAYDTFTSSGKLYVRPNQQTAIVTD
ncbi:MAG: hypothetical protein V3V75_05360 [Thermoguttaceae bacterium]